MPNKLLESLKKLGFEQVGSWKKRHGNTYFLLYRTRGLLLKFYDAVNTNNKQLAVCQANNNIVKNPALGEWNELTELLGVTPRTHDLEKQILLLEDSLNNDSEVRSA